MLKGGDCSACLAHLKGNWRKGRCKCQEAEGFQDFNTVLSHLRAHRVMSRPPGRPPAVHSGISSLLGALSAAPSGKLLSRGAKKQALGRRQRQGTVAMSSETWMMLPTSEQKWRWIRKWMAFFKSHESVPQNSSFSPRISLAPSFSCMLCVWLPWSQ